MSCLFLGTAYLKGKAGLEEDIDKALPFIEQACCLGNQKATFILAELYEYGKTPRTRGLRRALELYKQTCDDAKADEDLTMELDAITKCKELEKLVSLQNCVVTFLLARHSRCGVHSVLVELSPDIITCIAHFLWELKSAYSPIPIV